MLLGFSSLVSTVALRALLQARTDERVEQSLVQEVEEFRTLVGGDDPQTGEPFGDDVRAIFDTYLRRNIPAEGESVFTFAGGEGYQRRASNRQTQALEGFFPTIDAITTTRRGTLTTSAGEVRYLAVPILTAGPTDGVFLVTNNLGDEAEEVNDAVQLATSISLGVLLLGSLLAFVIAGRVLGPLRDLTDTSRSITETDLSRRITVQGDDEIAELSRTFNAMLDRIETAFAGQKAFVSDAGHELRTPITIIRGHLELMGDDPQERRETVALVTDELDRMSRFVDDLLLLARAEQGDFLHLADVDLDVLTEELLAKAVALAPRDWRLEGSATGRLVADRQRLTQAVMQLAVNAAQHTSDGDRIGLGTSVENGHARLWVSDTGPGVPEEERERIFERFARAGSARRRSDGAGLGLAIVRAIAEGHGGRVELLSRPGQGSTFTVVVPTQPPEEVAP